MADIHLTRAIHKNTKEVVSIESVQSGLQDDVVCACCNARLIANKGKVKRWYFSHYGKTECAGAYETQLHLTAKEFFSHNGEIPHPLENGWVPLEECEIVKINPDSVRVEIHDDNRVPDLIVDIGSERYWIEIANKHQCDASKVAEARQSGRNIIEVDVSFHSDLDVFNSTRGCMFKVLSLSPFNDLHEAVAESARVKQRKARERSRVLRNSMKSMDVIERRIQNQERDLKEREINYEKRLHNRRLNIEAQEKVLVELKLSIAEFERRKAVVQQEFEMLNASKIDAYNQARAEMEKELSTMKRTAWSTITEELTLEKNRLRQEYVDNILVDGGVLYKRAIADLQKFRNDATDFSKMKRSEADEYVNERRQEYRELMAKIRTVSRELDSKSSALRLSKTGLEATIAVLQDKAGTIEQEVKMKSRKLDEISSTFNLLASYGDKVDQVREYHEAKSDVRHATWQMQKDLELLRDEKRKTLETIEFEKENFDIVIKAINSYCNQIKSLPNDKVKEISGLDLPDFISQRLKKNSAFWPTKHEHVLDDMAENIIF
ncbi:competence protein CoiA family protein [Photobacterium sp. TY1-4]|uniref:competence protein CoiA family protein n=1 Tax=Photobacterium sp. TY1-4 TaxID=2899122 RepID=UPI0021C08A2B|nr:competence protein CoiA family protein [Photobacterium sp. TY1-4]UXI04686.1 hypothetical protein NH461_25305 [Photobacterium sp. TY1-4]